MDNTLQIEIEMEYSQASKLQSPLFDAMMHLMLLTSYLNYSDHLLAKESSWLWLSIYLSQMYLIKLLRDSLLLVCSYLSVLFDAMFS